MAQPQPSRAGLAPLGSTVPSHPGLRLLADVSAALQEGVFSEAAMVSVVAILRRGFDALAFSSPGVPGARPSIESAERFLMWPRIPSAVMASAAVLTAGELASAPVPAEQAVSKAAPMAALNDLERRM